MFTIHHGGPQQVELITAHYEDNDQLYVALEQGDELYADLSVCVPGVTLKRDEFVFKTYSENEGLLKAMLYTGKIKLVRTIDHALGTLPICLLCDE